jgi:hypothetical protein
MHVEEPDLRSFEPELRVANEMGYESLLESIEVRDLPDAIESRQPTLRPASRGPSQ